MAVALTFQKLNRIILDMREKHQIPMFGILLSLWRLFIRCIFRMNKGIQFSRKRGKNSSITAKQDHPGQIQTGILLLLFSKILMKHQRTI